MKVGAKGWGQLGGKPEDEQTLTPDALAFLNRIDNHFGKKRSELLKRRHTIDELGNNRPSFLREIKQIREGDWTVSRIPEDVKEIAARKILLRGLHLEKLVDGHLKSASFYDFANHFFHHNYFYLPTLDNALEARLWNDVFVYAQNDQRLPLGTIKVIAVINSNAAMETEEILYELKEHCIGVQLSKISRFEGGLTSFMNTHSFVKQTCEKRRALVLDNRTAEITHT